MRGTNAACGNGSRRISKYRFAVTAVPVTSATAPPPTMTTAHAGAEINISPTVPAVVNPDAVPNRKLRRRARRRLRNSRSRGSAHFRTATNACSPTPRKVSGSRCANSSGSNPVGANTSRTASVARSRFPRFRRPRFPGSPPGLEADPGGGVHGAPAAPTCAAEGGNGEATPATGAPIPAAGGAECRAGSKVWFAAELWATAAGGRAACGARAALVWEV
ncbi:hypothetical protein GCM10027167_68250 [Nocardia heshunensis]